MATQTLDARFALENGADERVLYLKRLTPVSFNWATINLADLVDESTFDGNDEPDYEELAMNVADAVRTALDSDGWFVLDTPRLTEIAHRFVSPGPGHELADGTFTARKRVAEPALLREHSGTDALNVNVVESGTVRVEIDDPYGDGDRLQDLPTILMSKGASWSVRMTWTEARALAAALTQVTDIAENG